MKAIAISSFHQPPAYHHASLTEIVGVFFKGKIGKNSNFNHRSGRTEDFQFQVRNERWIVLPSFCELKRDFTGSKGETEQPAFSSLHLM